MSLGLKELLKSKNKSLYHNSELVAEKAEYFLQRIAINFPQYTLHDIKHSESVIIQLNTIIPYNLKENLNEYEIFFLLCSAYLHDLGMADLEQIKDYWGDNPEVMREHHHERSFEYISKHFREVELKNHHQGNIVSKICLGHRKENLYDKDLFPAEYAYSNHNINIALLATLLRIADELDLTFERAPVVIYENFDISDDISQEEWKKHLSISGVTLSNLKPWIIKCNAICENPKIHRALKKLEVKVNSQLIELSDHLHNYNAFIKDIPREFSIDIENKGYEVYDFKFSLDEKAIFQLLMGENLYKSKDESIRELLKNSIDACRFRREITSSNFEPEIAFELTTDEKKLIVTDNGVGMDDINIEKYFTKIGRSFYRSEDFLNQELDFNPINELGIGFLSCYMIADKIIIDTKTEHDNPLNIEIDSASDYFIVKESKKESTGTDIILSLKEDVKDNLDLEKIIKNYARHLEFPIYVNLPDGREIEVKKQEFKPCFDPKKENIITEDIFVIKIEDDDFEGSICFEYGEDFYNYKDIVFNRVNTNKILCNQGIFVNDNIDLLSQTIESLASFDINLKKNVLDLNIARNTIQYNDKYEKFTDKLELIIFDNIKDLFLKFKDSRKQIPINTFYNESWKEIVTINSFFDNSGWSLYYNTDIKIPESYLKLFSDFYTFICVSNNGISFVNIDDLLSKRIIYVDHDFEGFVTRKMLEEHLEYVFNSIELNEDCIYILEPTYNSKQILESFLDYKPQSFKEILLKKYENSPRINDIIIPFDDSTRKNIIIINSNKCHDNRFTIINFDNNVFINENNKLIQFIIKNKDSLTENEKIVIEKLFNRFRNSFYVHEKYENIIKMFVSNKKIKDDPSSYSLDKKELDLCRNNYIWKHE
jgi:hypothetical protein